MWSIGSQAEAFTSLNPRFWISAGTGVTTWVNGVTNWASQVNGLSAATQWSTSFYPKMISNGLNFNPVIGFNFQGSVSDGFMLWGNWLQSYQYDYADLHIYTVALVSDSSTNVNTLYSEWDIATVWYAIRIQSWANAWFFYSDTAQNHLSRPVDTLMASQWNKPAMMSFVVSKSGTNSGATMGMNGKMMAKATSGNSGGPFIIGWWWPNPAYVYIGRMSGYVAEMIGFASGGANLASKQSQIESYLMVKYGIAPDTSNTNLYNTANGLVWNTTTNSSYNNSVFGIGRDIGSSLNSTMSESSTSTSLRVQSSAELIDQQYLLFGDNNSAMTWWSIGVNAPINMVRLGRMWYAQKTWPTNSYTTTISIPATQVPTHTSNQYYLAVDTDTDFSNASFYPMTNISGRLTVAWITINNGQYVTLIAWTPATVIGDRAWVDANKNGIQDSGEIGLPSVTVTLRSCGGTYLAGTQPPTNYNGTTIATTTTNAWGNYSFTVAPGVYYLEFTPSTSYKFTTQHEGWYGINTTTNSDAHPHSGKTRCENFASNIIDNSIDVWLITQSYSSCDSLTLSNVVTIWANRYQKPNVSFTATLAWYGQNASLSWVNVAGWWSFSQAPWIYNWSPSLSSSALGTWTINAAIDGYGYKLDYYNNPSIGLLSTSNNSSCPYITLSPGVFCAQQTPLAPYVWASANMNNSPTTIAPIQYCTISQSLSNPCTPAIDQPQSALVRTNNTCTQTITIMDEAAICNTHVTDMSPADCNALISLYNANNGANWTTKTNWLFNGDTSWNTACDWFGVSCTWGRVSRIDLSNNNVVGTLTNSSWTNLSSLTGLRYLAFASNTNLSGSLPTSWSTLTALTGLVLSGTRVSGSLPTSWSTLTALTTFNAYNLRVNGGWLIWTIPSGWSTMPLVNFYVSNNSLTGQLPSWATTKTSLVNLALGDNNLDGPIPDLTALTNLANAWLNSTIGSNCMGTGSLTAWQQAFMDARFKADATTSWNNASLLWWRTQKACATTLSITSYTITAGDLVGGNTATYSITIQNQWTRWTYKPYVWVSMWAWLSANTTTLMYGTLAPGASQTLTFIASKGSLAAGTTNILNMFFLFDADIPGPPISVQWHTASVRWSTHAICNNSALNITVGDCEALGDLYDSTNGASWTNKTNRKLNPNTESRWWVRTTQNNSWLIAHYNFEWNVATDVAGNGYNATVRNSPTFAAGTFANGITFNGSNQSIKTPTLPLLNNLTVGMRVKHNGSDDTFDRLISSANNFELAKDSAGVLKFYSASMWSTVWTPTTYTLPLNQWAYIAVVKNGATVKVYANGNEVLTTTRSNNAIWSSQRAMWCNTFDGECANASIDEARIYNRALSVGEITSLMNSNNITTPWRVTGLGLGKNNSNWDFYRCSGNCGNNLSGSIPASFGNLTELINVFMNNNLITSLPSSFWNLNKVQYLMLANNPITGSIPATVSNMTAMYHFQMNSTSITWPLPSQLFSLPNLGFLILSSNNLNSAIPTLTYNPSLTHINLNSWNIVGNPFAELVKMTNLTQLHIGGNPWLTWPVPSTINNLTQLTQLNISSNSWLSNTSLPNITISTLTGLYASASNFTGALPSLPVSIRHFEAQDNQFNGSLPSSWSALINLQYLYLWSNKLSWVIPSSWSSLTNLRRLWLGNNDIEWTMPVSTFQAMTSLENNPWWSMLGTNCMYTGSLTTGQRGYLDTKFNYWPNVENNPTWNWRNQKACGTDLEVVSATPSGTLQWGGQITYTVTIRNNGPRVAYDPKLNITLTNGLQFSGDSNSSQIINLGQMTAWQTIVQTIIVNKLWVGNTTINYTNTFAVADASTTDTASTNNNKSHAGTANGSTYPICLNPATTVAQWDCEALGDLYASTVWANWNRRDNWLSSTNVDSWFGVTVSGSRVTKLCLARDTGNNETCDYYLSGNNVVWSLPTSITNLTELTHLTLSKNSITGPLPSSLWNLTKLQYFYFNENQINGSIPTSIGTMNALITIFAQNNQLTGAIPSQIANLPVIQYIHFAANNLNGIIPDLTNLNDTLYYLILSDNKFTGPSLPTAWLTNMTNLRYLHLANNNLMWWSLDTWICGYTYMQDLYLNGMNLTGSIPSCVNTMWSAQSTKYTFAIHNNNLTWSIPSQLGDAKYQYYYLSNNPNIRSSIPSSFGTNTWILQLFASNMWLVWAIPSSFANLNLLNRFEVQSNYLDRDINSDAIIPPSLSVWYNGIATKFRNNQWDITPPTMSGSALTGTYYTDQLPYAGMVLDGSDFALAGSVISVGWGGSCSNITVTGNAINDKWLIAYYTFDNNNSNDLTANGFHGTSLGGLTFTTGYFNKAAEFDGIDDRITWPNIVLPTTMTISAWVKKTASTSQRSFFSNRWGGSVYFGLSTNQIFFYDNGWSPSAIYSSAWTITQFGEWAHIVAASDWSSIKLYMNGNLVHTQAQTRTTSAGTIGIWWDPSIGGEYWSGSIDDVRVYNRTLSSWEIFSMYQRRLQIAAQGTYNACYLTTVDRAWLVSNQVPLGTFTTVFSPYPICNNPARTVPQSECTALMDLYTSTAWANWTNKTNWGISPDMWTWYGIQLTDPLGDWYRRVKTIDLWSEDGFGSCSQVTSRWFTSNMVGILPESLGNLQYLEVFAASSTGLVWWVPTSFQNLPNLKSLCFDYSTNLQFPYWFNYTNTPLLSHISWWYGAGQNRVNEVAVGSRQLHSSFASLTNLNRVILPSLWLTQALPNLWSNSSLVALYLYGNSFSGPLPTWLWSITWLSYISLYSNQLSWSIPSNLGRSNIIQFNLSNNFLTGLIPPSFTNFGPSTTVFSVANNRLDRDLNNDAFLWWSLASWYSSFNPAYGKSIASQTDLTAPVISWSTLVGTISANAANYTITLTETSTIPTIWQIVTVGWGGTCSQMSVSWTLLTNGANIIQLRFVGTGTTNYNNCTLTTTDRAGNISNAINLGNWSVFIQPYPVCSDPSLTIPQSECVVLGDFYTNMWGPQWNNTWWWMINPNVSARAGITVTSNRVSAIALSSRNISGDASSLASKNLSMLTWLTSISMTYNTGLYWSLPSEWSTLTSLTGLTFSYTKLSWPLPTSWSTLTSLTSFGARWLRVRGGWFTWPIPSTWSSMPLTSLNLDNNNLNGPLPSWILSKTSLTTVLLADNNFDGPMPDLTALVNISAGSSTSTIGSNCMGTGSLTAAQTWYMDVRFSALGNQIYDPVLLVFTWVVGHNWKTQKICTGDVWVTVTQSWSLTTWGNVLQYTITVSNPWTRWAYRPVVNVTLGSGLLINGVGSTSGLVFWSLAPLWWSQAQVITVTKSVSSPTTLTNVTNTFTVSDNSIIDPITGNNTVVDIEPVRASVYAVCNNSWLTVTVGDCEWLSLFYDANNGSWWTATWWWKTNPIVSSWAGITTSGNRVATINQYNNNLSGSTMVDLCNLTELTDISLWLNANFRPTIPSCIGSLTKLEKIWLYGSATTGSLPVEFYNLVNLKIFNIMPAWYVARMYGTISWAISNLTKLEQFIIPYHNFTGWLPGSLYTLPLLKVIVANNNFNLGGTISNNMALMNNLQVLQLNNTNLWWVIPSSLTNPNLTLLNLANNNLSGQLPQVASNMTLLRGIDLSNNALTGAIPLSRSGLTALSLGTGSLWWAVAYCGTTDCGDGWSHSTYGGLKLNNNNLDRDHNNNVIIIPDHQSWYNTIVQKNIASQWDITPPSLTFTSMATSVDDVVQITLTLTEWSSTTWAGYLSGLTMWFTGSTACASLSTSPVRTINKWSMTIDVIWAAGTYAWCSMWVRDRANLISNLMSPGTIVIPNYAICGTVTDMVRSDCKALVDIFTSTNGTSWTNKTNWMWLGDSTPTTAGDRDGIQVSNNRVTRLSLGNNAWYGWAFTGNNLSGTLPQTLGNLTWLTILDIVLNPQLIWNLPSSIGNLSLLQRLIVTHNGLWWVVPTQISLLTGLQNLMLSSNNFSGTLDVLTPMKKLSLMMLDWNKFIGSIPAWFGEMTGMSFLYLHDNQLSGPIPSSLGNLTGLNGLILHSNNLVWLIPDSLKNLTNLQSYSNLTNNCLSSSSSYMSVWLLNNLTTRWVPYLTQKSCNGTIWSRVWLDNDNDGLYDNGETGTWWVTVTLRSCSAQVPTNTWGKLLNHQLIAHYTFDANNTVDDSFNGNDGVNNGVTFVAGKMGSAASFNGGSHITVIENSTPNRVNRWQITYGWWFRANTMSTRWGIVSRLSSRWSGYNLSVGTVERIACWWNDYVNSDFVPVVWTWYHAMCVFDGSVMRLYVNGVLQSDSVSYPNGLSVGADSMKIGVFYTTNSLPFDWLIDDVRIYSRALSASEIAQLYNIDSSTPAINFPIGTSGAVVATTTSAANGTYSFTNQPAGRYYLEYSNVPNGYKFTTQNWWWYHNSANSDVNPWSAKTSCFELYNGLNEIDIDAGLKYLPYSSCEWSSTAFNPILLGEPVTLGVAWYWFSGAVAAYNSIGTQVLNVAATTTSGAAWWLKTWTYNWTPPATGTYTISWLVDGYNYKLDYYNNPALSTLSCAYRTISPGNWCAVQTTTSPYSGTALTNVNQIASIPAPIQYCTPAQISWLPCSTAWDQPPAMVVQVPNTCASSVTVTNDISVMCNNLQAWDMSTWDCMALVSLYDSTAGAGWTNKQNWRFIGDATPRTACDWTGVVCNAGRAVEINFPVANNLIGTLPPLTGMTALSGLHFRQQNGLTWQLPSTWATNLPAIRKIYIATLNPSLTMWINGTLPTSWWSMSGLRNLTIARTNLTGTLPDVWSGMRSLESLSFTFNTGVSWPLPSSWSTMTWLKEVYLNGNNLSWPLPSSWSSMTWMLYFYAPTNNLSWPLPSSWSSMTSLLQLLIGENTGLQTTIPSSWFTGMTSLNTIQIHSWWMNWPLPQWMMNWTNLTGVSSIRYNCMGTTNLSPWFVSWLNIYFPARWSEQNICDTDLQLAFVSKTWDLLNSNNMTYTLRYTNAGSRWSYNTQIGLSMLAGMGVTTGMSTSWLTLTGLNVGIVAPGTSGLVNITINNGTLWSWLYSSTQIFTISDTTVNDTVGGNNSYTDSNVPVLVSSIPICNNALLTIPRLECEALFSWFNGLSWPSWTNSGWWNWSGNNYDANTWYGVTVSWGRVTQLNYLTGNNLSGTITSSLSFLTALDTLRIHNQPKIIGQLSGSSFFSLTGSLKILSISGSSLAWPVPAVISNLASLRVLALIGNKPTTWFTSLPSSLWTMTSLTWLDLSNNYFTGLLPSLAWFTSLKEVSFANNAFTGTLPAGWSSIPFTRVNISNNTIQWLFTGYQSRWATLNKIYLDNNNFDGPIPEWITNLINLN
jgi:uncharacterized repeat protein (TIGR01451 family)